MGFNVLISLGGGVKSGGMAFLKCGVKIRHYSCEQHLTLEIWVAFLLMQSNNGMSKKNSIYITLCS